MQSLIPDFFNPIAAIHHYSSMAAAAFAGREDNGAINTKKLFYALRAVFACRWIERHISQPPTEFQRLVESVADENEKSWIADLLMQKANGRERDQSVTTGQRLDRMLNELAGFESYATRAPRPLKANPDALDAILRQWTR
jgi:predicted nucleotidyltransferase